MFRARKVGWGFVGRMHGLCMVYAWAVCMVYAWFKQMANQTKCGLICWKIRDDVLPPLARLRQLSQRLPVSRASWVSTPAEACRERRPAPGCCRLLPATPVCPGTSGRPRRFPVPSAWRLPASCASDPWRKHQQRCHRLRPLAVAANCCRQLLPLLFRRNL